jgi:hypothetical protein
MLATERESGGEMIEIAILGGVRVYWNPGY